MHKLVVMISAYWQYSIGWCMCCMLSSMTEEHVTVNDDTSLADTHSVNVCPAASNSATFRWEWNGTFAFSYLLECIS